MSDNSQESSVFSNVSGAVNSPEFNEQGAITNRAISDGRQAWNVYRSLFEANGPRNRRNAEIYDIYTGRQPYDPKQLRDEERDWQSNFPTLFLAGIMDRVVPNLVKAVDSAQYLTTACLEGEYEEEDEKYNRENLEQKTQLFRQKFTKKIRQWDGWRSLITQTSQENVLLGYTHWVWTDEETPFPQFARSDNLALPDGTPQESRSVQVFAFEQPVLIHEFIEMIKVSGAFEGGGWNKDECELTANHALPFDPTKNYGENGRGLVDIIREGNLGSSYAEGAKVVRLGHLLAVEPKNQKVSHYIIDAAAPERVLFQRLDRFESMEDVVSLFALEPGNGKLHGSKGIGRMIANFGVAIDEIMNDAVDKVRMDGLPITSMPANSSTMSQIRVRKPFIAVVGEVNFKEQRIEFDPEKAISLVSQLGKTAEIAAGAYIPNLMSTESNERDKTAREATIDYNRELQSQSAYIIRFMGQLSYALSCIQRRMCNPDSSDDVVKEFIEELKEEGFTNDEIRSLAEYPNYEIGQALSDTEGQKKIALYNQFAGNPLFDQVKLASAAAIALSDPEFAESVILPEGIDPTIESENVRQQIIENAAIMTGESVPISPRDNHSVHLKTLIGDMQTAIPQLIQDPTKIVPELLDHINAGMIHGQAHLEALKKMNNAPDDSISKFEDYFKFVDKFLKTAAQELQKKQVEDAKMQQKQAEEQQSQGAESKGYNPAEPTEKMLIAIWGQYDKLPEDEKRQLESLSGLKPSQLSPPVPVPPPEPDMPPQFPPEAPPPPQNGPAPVNGSMSAPPPPPAPSSAPPPPPPPDSQENNLTMGNNGVT